MKLPNEIILMIIDFILPDKELHYFLGTTCNIKSKLPIRELLKLKIIKYIDFMTLSYNDIMIAKVYYLHIELINTLKEIYSKDEL
jgi:large-conductance mechanosensitive channel